MKEFFQVLRRFVPPYKKYLVLTVVFNILSAILNIFSFLAIMPILKILFKIDTTDQHPVLLSLGSGDIKEVLTSGNLRREYMNPFVLKNDNIGVDAA